MSNKTFLAVGFQRFSGFSGVQAATTGAGRPVIQPFLCCAHSGCQLGTLGNAVSAGGLAFELSGCVAVGSEPVTSDGSHAPSVGSKLSTASYIRRRCASMARFFFISGETSTSLGFGRIRMTRFLSSSTSHARATCALADGMVSFDNRLSRKTCCISRISASVRRRPVLIRGSLAMLFGDAISGKIARYLTRATPDVHGLVF